ncbi:WD40-repeat-containing domain protein [Limtongia smithiae]|uniref:WD40-repeat-containing domain protein n=1 Tax=Limtongia smithiae TaxID=1125753 RepID=UPI0034CE3463
MPSSYLTSRQKEELNSSILEYLASSNLTSAHDSLAKELNRQDATFEQDLKRYDGLLEKKWTSVVRLQRKIMDLEAKVSSLQAELDNMPASKSKVTDTSTWLPRTAKFTLLGHRQAVTCIAFHSIFTVLASGSEDMTIKIWDWELGELEQTLKGHTKSVLCVDFSSSPEKSMLASCSADLTIKLWSVDDEYKNTHTLKGHDHTVSCVRFFPDGRRLISASRDKTMRVWSTDTGYCLRTITGHADWIRCVDIALDASMIISAGSDHTARVTDPSTGDCKLEIAAHEHVIECCAVAPGASSPYIANLAQAKPAAHSPTEFQYFATGGRDRLIKLWDSNGNLIHTFEGHENWVRAIVFHPGGKFLLSTGDDRSIRCWDLSDRGRCVRILENAHEDFVSTLKWAPSIVRKPLSQTNGTGQNNNGSIRSPFDNASIRCVVATASAHLDVKVWMS